MKKPYRVTIALLLTMVCFIGFNKKIFASEYNVVATTKENKWYKVQESGNYYKIIVPANKAICSSIKKDCYLRIEGDKICFSRKISSRHLLCQNSAME